MVRVLAICFIVLILAGCSTSPNIPSANDIKSIQINTNTPVKDGVAFQSVDPSGKKMID